MPDPFCGKPIDASVGSVIWEAGSPLGESHDICNSMSRAGRCGLVMMTSLVPHGGMPNNLVVRCKLHGCISYHGPIYPEAAQVRNRKSFASIIGAALPLRCLLGGLSFNLRSGVNFPGYATTRGLPIQPINPELLLNPELLKHPATKGL